MPEHRYDAASLIPAPIESLCAILASVETMLAGAVYAQLQNGFDAARQTTNGLISTDDLILALCAPDGVHRAEAVRELGSADPLGMAERFGLDEVDHALLLLAIVADMEPRLSPVLNFLATDSAGGGLTSDLALRLVVGDGVARLTGLSRLRPGGSLVHLGLIKSPRSGSEPGLCQPVRPTPGLVALLVGAEDVWQADAGPHGFDDRELDEVRRAWIRARSCDDDARLALVGGDRNLRVRVASELAASSARSLVVGTLEADEHDAERARRRSRRDALLRGAILYTEDVETLERLRVPGIVGSDRALPGISSVNLPRLGRDGRRRLWRAALAHDELVDLATDRYRLDPGAIERTAGMALATSLGRGNELSLDDLAAAARANASARLSTFATAIEPRATWSDLILPAETHRQLADLVRRVECGGAVLDEWGFRRQRRGDGISALFAGASGVGKSMAAEVVAGALKLPLWRVELARVVSKYIGETEKHLDDVFAAAEESSAMLLFDEADALFGKRSEVQDAHDRYANLEISYLLQRMESYTGVVILSTNLLRHLDDAFARRLTFTIHFPFPEAALRAALWASAWPREAELGADLDFGVLAIRPLSGGNISNAALAAAHLARAEGMAIGQRHVERAIEGELSKLGHISSPEEAA